VLAGCTECFSTEELEAGSCQAGTAGAVVYGQHLPGTPAWQQSGDVPELLLAELPELKQGWEAWEAGRWALEEEMELNLPLVGGNVLPVCYRLVAVIQYDGGHYACDARDPFDDCWYRYDALHGAPTPTPAVPTVAPLGPGRAVEPDLMQSRAARCWPVLAAWAVVPLDELQIMLVDAVTVRPAADAAMRARVDSDVDVKMDNGVVINPLLRQSYGKAKT